MKSAGQGSTVRNTAVLLVVLIAVEAYFTLFLTFDWGHGLIRGAMLGLLLVGLSLLLRRPATQRRRFSPGAGPGWLRVLTISLIVLNLAISFYAISRSLRSGEIPLDPGQTTWRAARLLRQGENPYATGALVDFYAFDQRSAARQAAGLESAVPLSELAASQRRYDATLDPQLKRQLLPADNGGGVTAAQRQENSLAGYKYGPVILLLTALFVPAGLPAIVMLLNGLACFGLFAILFRLFQESFRSTGLALLGVSALLLDRPLSWNFLNESATDIYALFFCALAVLAFVRARPSATAVCLAAALGCKIFPAVILLPLLLQFRAIRPLLLCAACVAAIYLPWLAWDPVGLIYNAGLWPSLMAEDTTAWLFYVPTAVTTAVRILVFLGIVFLWFRFLSRRETRLFATLALANTILLLAGGVFHNNYLPWASIWIVAAIIESVAEIDESGPREQCA
jgi:hypothetical protein